MRGDSPEALSGFDAGPSLAVAAAEQNERATNRQAPGLMTRGHISRPSYGTATVNVEGAALASFPVAR